MRRRLTCPLDLYWLEFIGCIWFEFPTILPPPCWLFCTAVCVGCTCPTGCTWGWPLGCALWTWGWPLCGAPWVCTSGALCTCGGALGCALCTCGIPLCIGVIYPLFCTGRTLGLCWKFALLVGWGEPWGRNRLIHLKTNRPQCINSTWSDVSVQYSATRIQLHRNLQRTLKFVNGKYWVLSMTVL